MNNKSSKKIVLTGVTKGLGRYLLEGFLKEGHTVIGCGRSKGIIEDIKSEFGSPHIVDSLDLTKKEERSKWAKKILNQVGPPDFLINNAGVINKPNPLWKISIEEFAFLFEVNVMAVADLIRLFLPAMIKNNRGVIVNFSSGWGRSVSPDVAPYCASKWAIEGLTKALAEDLPKGLAAIALNPGIINTDMLKICFGKEASHYPNAKDWSQKAVPFLLRLSEKDNGRSLTVPG